YLRAQSLQIVRALRRPKMAHRQSAQAVVLGGIQVDKLIRGTGGRRAPPGLRAVSQIGREARVVGHGVVSFIPARGAPGFQGARWRGIHSTRCSFGSYPVSTTVASWVGTLGS